MTRHNGKPRSRSLREQLTGLRSSKSKAPEKDRPSPPPASEANTFAGLVGPVAPIDGAPRVSSSDPTEPHFVRGAERRVRRPLTVLREELDVRARADGVPERVVRELTAGRPHPTREIDLHGLRAARAGIVLSAAVENARRAGVACLLVICGRGRHSETDPVLPEVAIERLSESSEHVLAFATAPPRFGGVGALLVRLRPR